MELIDEDDDIFTPKQASSQAANGLNKLFGSSSNSPSNSDLKYSQQNPNQPAAAATKNEASETTFTAIVSAFAWDGKAYKAIGKLGLALVSSASEKKLSLILYKSKQQILSSTDLSLEQMKVEQQAQNIIGNIDSQGRAWSFQFENPQVLDDFIRNLVSLRASILNKEHMVFLQNKGGTEEVKVGDIVKIEITGETIKEMLELMIDAAKHDFLVGKASDCQMFYYGDLSKISGKETLGQEVVKLKLNGLVKFEKKEKYAKKFGKSMIPQLPNPKEEVLEVPEKIEQKPPKEKPVEKPVVDSASTAQNQDLTNLIITENRLQNTELRMAMMSMNEKLDKILHRETSNNPSSSSASSDQDLKKIMNKMFKNLKAQIDPKESYSGQQVLDLLANCIKSSTESALASSK